MKKIEFDFKNIKLATIESDNHDTGCTLVFFEKPCIAAVDIRGGAAAVREASSIEELNNDGVADAIVIAGGSTFGLEAASGVANMIWKKREYSTKFNDIPCVPSAIVYDFRNRKNNTLYPNREMGELAFKSLKSNQINIGQVGAGANVFVGKIDPNLTPEKAGQGAYFIENNGVKILVITVVNSIGNILTLDGQIIRGSYDPEKNKRIKPPFSQLSGDKGNTTITILITNVKLSRSDLKRLAVMTHTSMARVIEPFHTPWDGDTFFAVSTCDINPPSNFDIMNMGQIAITCAQNAVLNCF